MLNLLFEPRYHAGLGQINRRDRHTQPFGDLFPALTLHGGLPESLPRRVLKITPYLGGGSVKELLLILLLPYGLLMFLWCRQLL